MVHSGESLSDTRTRRVHNGPKGKTGLKRAERGAEVEHKTVEKGAEAW